ncbi:DUF397 domain-containing protein [Streptomyces brevispora]|uniref:DUF397 domain-containing protein n=1 Tax=Streptomyces brevispora TaxID=887462 RepID=UPI00381EA203
MGRRRRRLLWWINEGEACVEVAACPHTLHVRDSKVTDGPAFAVAPAAWTAFLGHAANV